MKPFGIAAMQLWVSGEGGNLGYLARRTSQLMDSFPWVQMVVFSELAVNGTRTDFAEPLPGPTERAFQEMAVHHSIWVITGSMYERVMGRIYNTCSVIDPSGRVVGRYRKMFPFRPFSRDVAAGTDFMVFDVPGVGRFGMSICYDMWFPETSRTLASMGAEVIIHPVLTATIDREVEMAITRATAVMNQCFVIDVNGAGAGGVGRSQIIGPDGDIIHEAGPNEELIPVEIDMERVAHGRERGMRGLGQVLKSFRDAPVRFDVYDADSPKRAYLKKLGPLEKPGRAVVAHSPYNKEKI